MYHSDNTLNIRRYISNLNYLLMHIYDRKQISMDIEQQLIQSMNASIQYRLNGTIYDYSLTLQKYDTITQFLYWFVANNVSLYVITFGASPISL